MNSESNSKIISALNKISFCERYKALSDATQFANNVTSLQIEEVVEIFKRLGYGATFNRAESFYKVVQEVEPFRFQFNISLKYGNVELIWDFLEHGYRLKPSGPWNAIYKRLLNADERILMPKYRNSEDLKDILKQSFVIYEDLKKELVDS